MSDVLNQEYKSLCINILKNWCEKFNESSTWKRVKFEIKILFETKKKTHTHTHNVNPAG